VDSAVKLFIGRNLENFNVVLQEIEGAGIRYYVSSLYGRLEEERKG